LTARSTRNKIRWQAHKMIEKVDGMMEHLRYMDELAEGRSEVIEKHTPIIVTFLEELKKYLERFRNEL